MKRNHCLLRTLGAVAVAVALGLSGSPAQAVPAQDGEGVMTVTPDTVAYGDTNVTLEFIFTAGSGDFGPGSSVIIGFPAGWSQPTLTGPEGIVSVNKGTCDLNSSPLGFKNPMEVTVDIVSCTAGSSFRLRYTHAVPGSVAGSPHVFPVMTDIPGGQGRVALTAGFPAVTVTGWALTVSATGLVPASRQYDGTVVTSVTTGSPALVGVRAGDDVALDASAAVGVFADRNVGVAKPVTIEGLALTGADASSYTLTPPVRAASIEARPVTVTAVTDTRIYDGTTASGGVPVVSQATPLIAGDSPAALYQRFATRNAGTAKSIVPAGLVGDGNGGLNYAYDYVPDATGVILPLAITVAAVPDTKIYDGTTSSVGRPVLSALTPLAPGDAEPVWTQVFDGSGAGTGKTLTPGGAVIDGNGGQNYLVTFVADTSGVITPRPATVAADAIVKGLGTPDPPLTFRVTSGSLVPGDELLLTRAPGEAEGTYPISIGSFPAAVDYDLIFIPADFTIKPELQFSSAGKLDGFVLESAATSGAGRTVDAKTLTFRVGDDVANRQYRAILSFDTSLIPNAAVITSVTLRLKRSGAFTGVNPFTVLGSLLVDVRMGTFGTPGLAATDFQAPVSVAGAAVVGKTPSGGWHQARLGARGIAKVNKAGITQLRLRFAKGDNGNRRSDFMRFLSGDASAGKPELIVTYTLP